MLLGLVLGLAFAPLYFAISTYTEVAIGRTQAEAARDFARSTARWVGTTPSPRIERLDAAFPADQGAHRVLSIGVYAPTGELLRRIGEANAVADLPNVFPGAQSIDLPPRGGKQRILVSQPGGRWNTSVLVSFERSDASALNRVVGLYMMLIGLALLVGVYFSVTALIIRPLDQISRAAKRVASANHRLELPRPRSEELATLAASLQTMTDRLANEETALRRKVEELEQAHVKLETAQAQVVRSERLASVGQLAAGLAHEIGNPLAAMQGMQDLILDGGMDAEQQLDFTRRMRKETERISSIIRNLLDFARPRQPDQTTDEPGNVESAVNETLTLVAPQPLLREIQLAVDVYPELPPVTLGQGPLTQVVLNLVLNAATACRDGGRVRVRAQRRGEHIQLVVEDNGPGVAPDLVDRVFEPFVSSKDVGEGSGLGLSVCRGLVEASGGRIYLDTEYEEGARFVAELNPIDPPN
jgi:signal transduction histidine kinase